MTLEEMYGNAKALVEDRTYNIGEISEKTGLQKTANGWVKPKSNKGAKKDASGADVLNNKYYKDDVRTAEGEAKIVSQMDTKGIQRRINELEALKKQNGGELGMYGERELKIKKAELEKRNKGNSTKNEIYEDDKVVKEIELRKAAMNGGTKEKKALFKFEAENADAEQLKHVLASKNQPADRIEMYQAELEKRNNKGKANFDEYGLPDNATIAMKDKFLKKENVKDPDKLSNAEFNALAKKLDSELGIGNMELAQELLVTSAENSTEKNKTTDSSCRITADTKIRLKK